MRQRVEMQLEWGYAEAEAWVASETPLCETVQTGSCSGVFGSDTACVEKPPADKSWSAQQYLDVMSALDSKMVMEQLIASLPPYAECGVNHTDAYKETCKRYYL